MNEKQEKILFYNPEEMEKIRRIQAYKKRKSYKSSINVKLMKSGLEFQLQISKIQGNTINFSIFDKISNKTTVYEIPKENVENDSKADEKNVIDHILDNIQLDPKEKKLVYKAPEKNTKKNSSLFIMKHSISLINFEKDYEFNFFQDKTKKKLMVFCFENRSFKLEMPLKDGISNENLLKLCENLLFEVSFYH